MDARRALPFLLLVICTINATIHNDRDGPSNVRRVRRISEYLVPPPPPRFPRIPRLANHQLANEPGYFARLMNWLNPFSSQPSPPPPLPPEPETYPPKFVQSDSLPLAATYNGPSLADYQKPPLPPPSNNDHSGYSASIRTKNCNSCNKVPWTPMQQSELTHPGGGSYAPSLESPSNYGGYPPRNPEAPLDTYHAASQEIRAPDFSFPRPLPGGQDNSFIGPLPNPQLYPGAMPPLFKAEDFNYPPQVSPNENSGYLGATSSSVSGNGAPSGSFPDVPPLIKTEDFNYPPQVSPNENSGYLGPTLSSLSGNGAPGSFLDVPRPGFNGENNGQSVYPAFLDAGTGPQESGYNPDANNGEFERGHAILNDLSSSGTQVSQGHAKPVPDKQGFEGNNKGAFGSVNHQTFPSGVLDGQPPRVSDRGPYDVTGASGSEGGFLDNTSQTDPPSYGTSDGFPGKIGDTINFEESPFIDFTHKGESRTHSSPIPPTSNALAGFESAENAATVAPGDEIFGIGIASTKSHHFSADYFETIDTVAKESKINNSAIQVDVARGSFRDVLLKPYDDVTDETLNDHINVNLDVSSERQGGKRNKQVQVIIPYTSQYTPLPFHPSDERKISVTGGHNHDNYVGEESINRINIVKPPNSSPIFQSPTTLPIFEDATRKPVAKANNSIDVHKLQKNIDNWTIQKYSKSPAVTTVSPSHWSNPYLLPSKTIPKEYFTTTEPIMTGSYNDNVKTFTLAGFSFNDQEYKGSASHHNEGSRIQVIKAENLTEIPTDPPTEKDMWRDFPVGISSDKERVYIVTPETPTTPISNSEKRRSKAKEAESNTKESKKVSQTKEMKKSDPFESIEKAYQVLPQAVNNLAVASTGPESVPLWGIMEHDDFASPVDNEYDSDDTESSVPYSKLSKKLRGKR